jgi:hypothetical protein
VGRFVLTLLLIGVVVLGLGVYLNWFDLRAQTKDDQVDVSFKVNKDKIRKDTETAAQEGKKAWNNAKDATQELLNRKTVKGTLMDVNAGSGTITVSAQDGALPIRVTDRTIPSARANPSP